MSKLSGGAESVRFIIVASRTRRLTPEVDIAKKTGEKKKRPKMSKHIQRNGMT